MISLTPIHLCSLWYAVFFLYTSLIEKFATFTTFTTQNGLQDPYKGHQVILHRCTRPLTKPLSPYKREATPPYHISGRTCSTKKMRLRRYHPPGLSVGDAERLAYLP